MLDGHRSDYLIRCSNSMAYGIHTHIFFFSLSSLSWLSLFFSEKEKKSIKMSMYVILTPIHVWLRKEKRRNRGRKEKKVPTSSFPSWSEYFTYLVTTHVVTFYFFLLLYVCVCVPLFAFLYSRLTFTLWEKVERGKICLSFLFLNLYIFFSVS